MRGNVTTGSGGGVRWALLCGTFALLATTLPAQRPAAEPGGAATARVEADAGSHPVSRDTIAAAIERRLGASAPAEAPGAARWRRVRALYAQRGNAPSWLGPAQDPARARALTQALASVHDDALPRAPFPLAALHRALAAATTGGATADGVAEADVLLTAAFVALAEDLLVGQLDPTALAQSWHLARGEPRLDTLVARAFRLPTMQAALAALRPATDDYAALRQALDRYRRIVAAGGWPSVPAGRTLSPGDSTSPERLAAIVGRLRAEGYLRDVPPVTRYDTALAGEVARFQHAYGIRVDSVLGPETLGTMNRPAEYRLGQIAANLERHRWLPRELPERHLRVNVAAFRLQGFEGEREVLAMRVITGSAERGRNTPSFDATVRAVIFRPYWNVPDRIAANEIWPLARRDAGYLERHRYEVVWRDGGRRLRQLPGPQNALGLMKLDMPNRFDVYLHDTPTKQLFCEDVRAFSHGCVRVEEPARLAQWVLGWDAERVRLAMEAGPDDERVPLDRPVPVRVVYLTTHLEDGMLRFGNDVYGRDPELVALLSPGALTDAGTARVAGAIASLLRE